MSTANPGYQAPTVTVGSSLPKRGSAAVLIVPVVSGRTTTPTATVVANPFLDAEAVGEIEVALKALGAKGGTEQVTRWWRRRCRWPACWRSAWARTATSGPPT